ncbi:MFS transporter [Saccharopolyspora shandongensis]|uniref:MFS transporter n=1 Tax=Saccharopolyspora shandongensis TaxID=418495 RepID=UPI003444F343
MFGTFSVASAEDTGLSTGPVLTGVMFVSAVKLVSVPLFGALSDRWGRRPVSILGAVVMAIACYPFFLVVDTEIALESRCCSGANSIRGAGLGCWWL